MNWLIFFGILGVAIWAWCWIALALGEKNGWLAFSYGMLAIPFPVAVIAGLLFA